MIGEYAPDSVIGSKKRSLTSPGNAATSIMSPPPKKMKQARLPFKVISSPSPNQCHKLSVTKPKQSKKRKLSGTDRSQTPNHPAKVKTTDVNLSARKFFIKKGLSSPVTPKNSRVEIIDLDPEVTSSCEDQESNKLTLYSVSPKRSFSSKPKSLDSFLQTYTQQPQVSTSEDVYDVTDDDVLIIDEGESRGKGNPDDKPSGTESRVADVESSQHGNSQAATPKTSTICTPPASETEKAPDDKDAKSKKKESSSKMDVSMSSCTDDTTTASKLSYDADSEDGDGDNDDDDDDDDDDEETRLDKSSKGSSEAESVSGTATSEASPITPRAVAKHVQKTPLSAKALKKLKEKEQFKEEKLKLRLERKRKLLEEEAERKRQKLELKKDKEREREEAKKQKEMEKDVKKKERQQKKDQEDKDKEEKRMAREEEKTKKQEDMDAKMEEKRQKNEERQRQEEEKQKQEEEKREKEAKQKTFFKSFFKEAVVPVKKTQEKSCGWFAPFQVKDDMVLAPVRRCKKLTEVLQEFDTAFQSQSSSLLYLDKLKSKCYAVGKTGRTPRGEIERKEASSLTVTPSVETLQQCGDSQDVVLVSETSAKPAKKLFRMKCKLLQFHENYRPAYYGTWRRKSRIIEPRNYLKKDEDLLDYEVDSDDEWEEPGESLSHSEGEDEGEEVDDGGESDDGFFVPHGYLSESEGCEDEEEIENWKEQRAAKAKSWEVELKRQQGVLKPVLIGCLWGTGSQQSTNKMLDAYKVVALTTVPIDMRSKKQLAAASNETPSVAESSRTMMQPKGPWNEIGTSLKRPVPAEAMPDLIRLVHGNTAGIKTLQREFREYWRLKDLSKMSGQTTPRPETPTAAQASQSVKTSEESQIVGTDSPGPGGSEVKTLVLIELNTGTQSLSIPTPERESTPVSNGGTPEVSNSRSSPTNPGDSIECSISKRQLMITINDIAVREKRAQFPRTCWYVHQHVLEKNNLLNLPIPSQWQNITKPQKTMRAESPVVGHMLPAYGTQTTSGYNVPRQGGMPVVIQQNQLLHVSGHQPINPVLYVPNSPIPHPTGMNQANVFQPLTTESNLKSLSGLDPQPYEPQPSNPSLPFQLQVANGMSASEIMQRLSATVPIQQNQAPPILSANPAHVFNQNQAPPILSANPAHVVNQNQAPPILSANPAHVFNQNQALPILSANPAHVVNQNRAPPILSANPAHVVNQNQAPPILSANPAHVFNQNQALPILSANPAHVVNQNQAPPILSANPAHVFNQNQAPPILSANPAHVFNQNQAPPILSANPALVVNQNQAPPILSANPAHVFNQNQAPPILSANPAHVFNQNQAPPILSANPAHVFNPIMSNQMHYLNMLPKPRVIPSLQTVGFTASKMNKAATTYAVKVPRTSPNDIKVMLSSQAPKPTANLTASKMNKAATTYAVKVPRTSPNDIKVMLSSQAPKPTANLTDERLDFKSTMAVSEVTSATSPANSQECATVLPVTKSGVKTLKSFFNVKPIPKSQPNQTELSNPSSKSEKMEKVYMEETKDAGQSVQAVEEKLKSCINEKKKVERNQEEMEVIEID